MFSPYRISFWVFDCQPWLFRVLPVPGLDFAVCCSWHPTQGSRLAVFFRFVQVQGDCHSRWKPHFQALGFLSCVKVIHFCQPNIFLLVETRMYFVLFCLLSVCSSLFVAFVTTNLKESRIRDLTSSCPGTGCSSFAFKHNECNTFWLCLFSVWTLWFVALVSIKFKKSSFKGPLLPSHRSMRKDNASQECLPWYAFLCTNHLYLGSSLWFSNMLWVSVLQAWFGLFLGQPPSDFVFSSVCPWAIAFHFSQCLVSAMLDLLCENFGYPFSRVFLSVQLWIALSFTAVKRSNMKHRRVPHSLFFVFVTFQQTNFCVRNKISFWIIRDLFDFDHTCGFPGEGPAWTCVSANVNSVNSHPHCLEWEDDLVCIQEARLSPNGIQSHCSKLTSRGRDFFYAKLLQPKRQKNGIKHVPHGGTVCIAPKDACRNFTQQDDATSLWNELAESTRVCAAWVQILPKL